MTPPLTREEAHRIALKLCGPPRVLSEEQVATIIVSKANAGRRSRRRTQPKPTP